MAQADPSLLLLPVHRAGPCNLELLAAQERQQARALRRSLARVVLVAAVVVVEVVGTWSTLVRHTVWHMVEVERLLGAALHVQSSRSWVSFERRAVAHHMGIFYWL